MALRVLFIGGTGVISSACSRYVIERGYELFLLTRGTSIRPVVPGAHVLKGDIREYEETRALLNNKNFDVVVNWVAYTPEHIEKDLHLFKGRTGQYIFISSASVYSKPPVIPVTETSPIGNPNWEYAQNKVDCEIRLRKAFEKEIFPVTIIRPSHTYDETLIPLRGRYTVIDRIRRGKKIIVHGDGTSLWTLTHNTDFARGFTGLLGNQSAIGETYHITSDELLTWNEIVLLLGEAAGAGPEILHVPSSLIAAYDPDWGGSLLGDKAHTMIFDNSKIKATVPGFQATIPFRQGVKEIISWYDADVSRRQIDLDMDRLMDQIVTRMESARPVLQDRGS